MDYRTLEKQFQTDLQNTTKQLEDNNNQLQIAINKRNELQNAHRHNVDMAIGSLGFYDAAQLDNIWNNDSPILGEIRVLDKNILQLEQNISMLNDRLLILAELNKMPNQQQKLTIYQNWLRSFQNKNNYGWGGRSRRVYRKKTVGKRKSLKNKNKSQKRK
jgi:hypothetical protein